MVDVGKMRWNYVPNKANQREMFRSLAMSYHGVKSCNIEIVDDHQFSGTSIYIKFEDGNAIESTIDPSIFNRMSHAQMKVEIENGIKAAGREAFTKKYV